MTPTGGVCQLVWHALYTTQVLDGFLLHTSYPKFIFLEHTFSSLSQDFPC